MRITLKSLANLGWETPFLLVLSKKKNSRFSKNITGILRINAIQNPTMTGVNIPNIKPRIAISASIRIKQVIIRIMQKAIKIIDLMFSFVNFIINTPFQINKLILHYIL